MLFAISVVVLSVPTTIVPAEYIAPPRFEVLFSRIPPKMFALPLMTAIAPPYRALQFAIVPLNMFKVAYSFSTDTAPP